MSHFFSFSLETARRTRQVKIDPRTDRLAVVPVVSALLGISNNRIQAYLAERNLQLTKGPYGAWYAKRGELVNLLRTHESLDPAVAARCTLAAGELESMDFTNPPRKPLAVDKRKRKRKHKCLAVSTSTIDVIAQDESWNTMYGDEAFYGQCSNCHRRVTPIGAHVRMDGFGFCCPRCKRDCNVIVRDANRRGRGRCIVWLKAFGDNATGKCHGGCGGTLHFTAQWDQGHIEADFNGGKKIARNLRPLCNRCNLRQGTEHLKVFRKRVRRDLPAMAEEALSLDVAEMLYDMLLKGHDPMMLINARKELD